jgi:hypothetical protein
MKTLWVLLAIAILVLVLGMRERFATSGVVPPPDSRNLSSPYPRADVIALYERIPQATRDAAIQDSMRAAAADGYPTTPEQLEERLIVGLGFTAAGLYRDLYKDAPAPLTETQIVDFFRDKFPPNTPETMKTFTNEAMKLLFAGKPVPGPTAQETTAPPTEGGNVNTQGTVALAPPGSLPPELTTPPAGPVDDKPGQSVLARTRPGTGDPDLRAAIATYAGVPVNDPLVNRMISQVQAFYDRVYVPSGKKMPSQADIRSFVDSATDIPPERRPGLTSAIDYWFTEPAAPGDIRLESDTPKGVGAGLAARPAASSASWMSDGTVSTGRVWGPPFSGLGMPRDLSGASGDGGDGYPSLLGPPPKGDKYWSNTMPSSKSLGSDPLSGFLPFSRQPGDMDLIPDPYRVSQSYSPSSYSSNNEPGPFLTDLSAFQK